MQQKGLINFIGLLCLGIGVLIFGTADAQDVSKPKPVEIATPQRGKIEQKTTYTGNLEADSMVEIYANVSGKLVALKVNEGDRVIKGDVLAETDSRELFIALKQAEAGLKTAEAQLSKVKATSQINIETQVAAAQASFDAAKSQLAQAQQVAQTQVMSQQEQAIAGVTAAKASLEKALQGARSQEVQQAKAAVSGAKATLKNAQTNFERMQKLHETEAISDQSFDTAKTQLDTAKAQHESLVEQLSLIEEGTRQEDIRTAEAQLTQAQASLTLARALVDTQDWKTQIALAESKVRQAEASLLSAQKLLDIRAWEQDIAAAQAQVDKAIEQLNLAKKRLADATITSPIDGIIVDRNTDLGDYAAAGSPGSSPILTIVKMDVVKAVFTVSETDLSNVTVGTAVSISAGQQHINGKINFISPIVNTEKRTVNVKAEIPNSAYRLKPGMFVEVNIDLSAPDETLLLLPREAVLDIQDKIGHVFIATDGKAQQQSVKVGLTWGENISIIEGLTDSTPVIVSGHRQLTDGTEILIVR